MNASDVAGGLAGGAADVAASAPGTAALLAGAAWLVARRRAYAAD